LCHRSQRRRGAREYILHRIRPWPRAIFKRGLFGRREFVRLHHTIDEQAQPDIGRHAPRRHVRRGEQAQFFQILHHIAD